MTQTKTTANLDQVREDIRYRLAGLTRRDIARATLAAKTAARMQARLRDRHGDAFTEAAARADASYQEHLRIWQSLHHQDEVYDPTAA